MARAICVNCNNEISLGPDAEEGQTLACPACKTDLKLVTDGEYLITAKIPELTH